MKIYIKLQKIIATALLCANISQTMAAVLLPGNGSNQPQSRPMHAYKGTTTPSGTGAPPTKVPQNLALSTNQLGITGPLNAGVVYSDLTGTYFNGQFLKKLNEEIGFNILGEYGDRQYRINGTLGLIFAAKNFFKISAEQLGQKLPFYFSTGNVNNVNSM